MCGNKLGSARTRAVSMRLLENTFPLKNRHFIWLCVSSLGHLENLSHWMTYKKTKKKASLMYPTNQIFTDMVPYMPLEVTSARKLLVATFLPHSNWLCKLGQVRDKKKRQKMLIFCHPTRSNEVSMDLFCVFI